MTRSATIRAAWIGAGALILTAVIGGVFTWLKSGENPRDYRFAERVASTEELVLLLDFRASRVEKAFDERIAKAKSSEVRDLIEARREFRDLHKEHLSALRAGKMPLAYEIIGQIQELLGGYGILGEYQ